MPRNCNFPYWVILVKKSKNHPDQLRYHQFLLKHDYSHNEFDNTTAIVYPVYSHDTLDDLEELANEFDLDIYELKEIKKDENN